MIKHHAWSYVFAEQWKRWLLKRWLLKAEVISTNVNQTTFPANIIWSKSTLETIEEGVEYVQSYQ